MRAFYQRSRYIVGAIVLVLLSLISCKESETNYHMVSGETWGTYYRVTMDSDQYKLHHTVIIKILEDFDNVLSTYVPTSVISKFNTSQSGKTLSSRQDLYFQPVYDRSIELHNSTEGYLDVTVMPLLNYWGFGYKTERRKEEQIDSSKVRALTSILNLSKLSRIEIADSVKYTKTNPDIQLDFSALAKGYGIDVIAEYLDKSGLKNYLIDIGGEARSKGLNKTKKVWSLAINKPSPEAAYTTQELIISLGDKSIATSGNYREMYEVDDRVYGHILNPITGYPWPSDLLSVSIIADDCITADGLATACIAAGRDKAKELLKNHPNVKACFIYDGDGDERLEKEYLGGFDEHVLIEN